MVHVLAAETGGLVIVGVVGKPGLAGLVSPPQANENSKSNPIVIITNFFTLFPLNSISINYFSPHSETEFLSIVKIQYE